MGYKQYFMQADKALVDEVRHMTHDKWVERFKHLQEDDAEYIYLHDVFDNKEIFEFGKYSIFSDFMYENAEVLFTSPCLAENYDEELPLLISQDVVLKLIDKARENVRRMYANDVIAINLVDKTDAEAMRKILEKILRTVSRVEQEWVPWPKWEYSTHRPANVSLEDSDLTCSWRHEYLFFDLVRIYKTFDFNKHTLLFWGW